MENDAEPTQWQPIPMGLSVNTAIDVEDIPSTPEGTPSPPLTPRDPPPRPTRPIRGQSTNDRAVPRTAVYVRSYVTPKGDFEVEFCCPHCYEYLCITIDK